MLHSTCISHKWWGMKTSCSHKGGVRKFIAPIEGWGMKIYWTKLGGVGYENKISLGGWGMKKEEIEWELGQCLATQEELAEMEYPSSHEDNWPIPVM